jgi:hypothetical protein
MISNYLANAWLDHTLRNVAFSPPSSIWLALLKAIPARQTQPPASEVSGGGYLRRQITFGTAAAHQRLLNTAAITFPQPTANWAAATTPVVAVALMDAETAGTGNWLAATPICSQVILSGNAPPKYEVGAIKVGLDHANAFASDYLINKLLDLTFRAQAFTSPAFVYLALLKSVPVRQSQPPTDWTEVTGTGYARKLITFGAAAHQRSLNSGAVTYDPPTADWSDDSAPVVATAIMDDAGSGGNWLFQSPVCPEIIKANDPAPKLDAGAVKVMMDRLAIHGC